MLTLLKRSSGIALLAISLSSAAQQVSRFPVTELNAGMYVIKAEVASTDAQRQQGLMFREKMAANEGMIFIFPQPAGICMWMKNTPLPLSVAFIDDKARIVNIEDMKPQTLDSHCAEKNVRYALEMNLGWFKQKGFKAGSTIEGIPMRK